jgi:hypothetical protein
MKLELKRKWFTDKSTIGELYVNGVFECFVLEDRVREVKIQNETAIPAGHYAIDMATKSPKFGRVLPRLVSVPGYTGVLIHPGNNPADTAGCLLPGMIRETDRVLQSKIAFDRLFAKLEVAHLNHEAIWLTITNEAH